MSNNDDLTPKTVTYLRLVADNDERPAPAPAEPTVEIAAPSKAGSRRRSRLLSSALMPMVAALGYYAADVSASGAQTSQPTLPLQSAVMTSKDKPPVLDHALMTLNLPEPAAPASPPSAGKPRVAQSQAPQTEASPSEPQRQVEPAPSALDKAAPVAPDTRAAAASDPELRRQIDDLRAEISRSAGSSEKQSRETKQAIADLETKVDDLAERSEFTVSQIAALRKRFEEIVTQAQRSTASAGRDDDRGYGRRDYASSERSSRRRVTADPSAVLHGFELKGVVGQVAWLETADAFMEVKPGELLPGGATVVAIRQFGDTFTVETDQGVVVATR